MTRRGTLIYYLTAWCVGCFSTSLMVWIRNMQSATLSTASSRSTFGLLFFTFYGLIFGAAAAFLGAFILRRIMALLKCKNPTRWAVAGAVLAPLLVAALGARWGQPPDAAAAETPRFLAFLTLGPRQVVEAGWWLSVPAGAATAYLLGRVERAFAPPNASSSANAGASA
jgi:hypothetical protein